MTTKNKEDEETNKKNNNNKKKNNNSETMDIEPRRSVRSKTVDDDDMKYIDPSKNNLTEESRDVTESDIRQFYRGRIVLNFIFMLLGLGVITEIVLTVYGPQILTDAIWWWVPINAVFVFFIPIFGWTTMIVSANKGYIKDSYLSEVAGESYYFYWSMVLLSAIIMFLNIIGVAFTAMNFALRCNISNQNSLVSCTTAPWLYQGFMYTTAAQCLLAIFALLLSIGMVYLNRKTTRQWTLFQIWWRKTKRANSSVVNLSDEHLQARFAGAFVPVKSGSANDVAQADWKSRLLMGCRKIIPREFVERALVEMQQEKLHQHDIAFKKQMDYEYEEGYESPPDDGEDGEDGEGVGVEEDDTNGGNTVVDIQGDDEDINQELENLKKNQEE